MKRILSRILPVTVVLALMAPAAFAQMPTPAPKGKGGPPKAGPPQGAKPQFQQQVVHQPTVTHTPMVSRTPQKSIVHTGGQPTPPPTGGKPLYHKPVAGSTPPPTVNKNITRNVTINKNATPAPGQGKPQFTKGKPGGNTSIVNNKSVVNATSHTTHVKQDKSWSGPKGGGGGGSQFNAANNYGGHWVAAGAVPNGWSRGGVHVWHNHHYRWFNGGWLIVDNGFWPTGYYQLNGGSKIWNAQAELANMGYYDGPVDGIPGPDTRQAIANYQADYNLPVTGHLNYPTQESLGLVDSD